MSWAAQTVLTGSEISHVTYINPPPAPRNEQETMLFYLSIGLAPSCCRKPPFHRVGFCFIHKGAQLQQSEAAEDLNWSFDIFREML